MDNRMSKYKVDENSNFSRQKRNEKLYEQISKEEIYNFDVTSNQEVIDDNQEHQIDVEKIKRILATKYETPQKRQSIDLKQETKKDVSYDFVDATKEYDINVILDKAREEKTSTYEEDRIKKLRDTQFDILKNLNLDETKELDEEEKDEKDDLLDLINTISMNENKLKETSLLSDLLSNGDTKKEDLSDLNVSKVVKEDKKEKDEDTDEFEFFTKNTKFKKRDYEEDGEKKNVFVEILIIIAILAFVFGMVVFFKTILNF